jgi:hypothetical protein
MKHTKTLATLFTAILVVTVFCGNYSFADFDARGIQEKFDDMNYDEHFLFHCTVDAQGDILTSAWDRENVDISAYSIPLGRSGSTDLSKTFFRSFCVEPGAPVDGTLIGTLSYEEKLITVGARAGETEWVTQTSEGNELTLGAAILYKEFAVDGRTSEGLRTAILVLMGVPGYTINSWADNVHLQYLYEISNQDKDVWTANYDPGQSNPGQYYDMVGDYGVFVLNVVSGDMGEDRLSNRQDFLYIAKMNTSTDVPEPASLLFWTLGGLGAAGTSWARKRRMKKLAAA